MKKIGILTCARSNDVCTRAGCLKSFHSRRDYFSGYDENTQLAVLMTCNGCEMDTPPVPAEDTGMREKLDRLELEEVSVMHIGACRLQRGMECSRITEICSLIESRGIEVVKGTHRE